MRVIIVSMAMLWATTIAADTDLTAGQVRSVLSEGKILSSALLTPSDNELGDLGFGPSFPKGTRIHEVFVFHKGEIYLCHLSGSRNSGTPPYASCVGYKNNL